MRAHPHSLLVSLFLLACQSSPPPAARVPPAPDQRVLAFEAGRAWAHLEALAEIGPRVVGTEGSRRARAYIRGELEKLEFEIREQRHEVERGEGEAPLDLVNLAARVPGDSDDVFLLAAPYDTRRYEGFRFLGVNDGGSGAALLLEMARVLAAAPLPYTTWLVFLDGEAPEGAPAAPGHYGSRALARRILERGGLGGIRLGLVLNRVCDSDLRVARDLFSHRIYREEFWRAAARLGRTDAFPPDAGFESPVASHRALIEAGLQRVVALVDTSFGGDEPPGLYDGTEDDDLEHCSEESLAAVGEVTLEALDTISRRLAKIDRFAAWPVEGAGALSFDALEARADEGAAVTQTGDEPTAPGGQDDAGVPTAAGPDPARGSSESPEGP